MKFGFVRVSYRNLVVVFVISSLLVVGLIQVQAQSSERVAVIPSVDLFVPINETEGVSSSTIMYPVVGVVQSTEEIFVRAKQAGVIENVYVKEGDVLQAGELISVQLDPVLLARLERQSVQNILNELGQESYFAEREQNLSLENISLNQSGALASLSEEANNKRVVEATKQVVTGLESAAVTLPTVLAFIKDNPSFFTAESMDLYRETLATLYGNQPNYLRVGALFPSIGSEGLLSEITNVNTASSSNIEIENVANKTISQVDSILAIFSESETEFLDRRVVSRDDERYASYNTYRSLLTDLKLSLQVGSGALASISDSSEIDLLNRKSTVSQSEISFSGAQVQADLGKDIYENTKALSAADRAVLAAEISLGSLRAPFAGIVTEVLVEEGEYVQSGTPLFKLVGVDSQEMVVKLPEQFISQVEQGVSFMLQNEIVGEVSRVVPVVTAGSISVYVDIKKPFVTGTVLRGVLSLPTEGNQIQVSRAKLSFATSGPYVTTQSGKKITVSIIHDAGENLIVVPSELITEPLLSTVGVRL